jgi:hypothetical protein
MPLGARGQVEGVFRTDPSDANADMFALRVRRELGRGFRAGLLGRSQRGQDLGTTIFMKATGPLSIRTYTGTFDQSWYALGGELSWEGPAGFGATASCCGERSGSRSCRATRTCAPT